MPIVMTPYTTHNRHVTFQECAIRNVHVQILACD